MTTHQVNINLPASSTFSIKTTATIVRVAEGGVAYAIDPNRQMMAGFTFGKIDGYRGETAKELGLLPGKQVTIEYDKDDKVSSVKLSAP